MGDRVAARVLVVEDDEAILRLMQNVLSQDFEVSTARSGEEALGLLRAGGRFQAVVADHMLPGMVGVELLRHVATLQPDAARVLVTASSRVEDAQDAINLARVKRFLAKPFRNAELLLCVGEAVHEAALADIRNRLVQELKARNEELGEVLGELSARDKVLSAQLEALAFRDPLTGLTNHRFFMEALSAELGRARRRRKGLALVVLDVDNFRRQNVVRGWAEGDALLRRVAQALLPAGAPAGGEAVARLGPDVFAQLVLAGGAPAAQALAERWRQAVSALGGGVSGVTASVAVALHPEHGDDALTLYDAALAALTRAKQAGGNRVALAGPG